MSIRFMCSCGATLEAADEQAGALVACSNCKAQIRVPLANEPAASPLEELSRHTKIEKAQEEAGGYSLFHPGGDPDAADFFVPAPDEIGPLRSAHTSLLKKTQPKSIVRRLVIGAIPGTGVSTLAALGFFFGAKLDPIACGVLFMLFWLLLTPFSLAIVWYFTRFSHYNGYVGELGVAFFTCKGSREKIKVRQTLLFSPQYELFQEKRHHFQKGAYTGTTYRHYWTKDDRTAVFEIAGQHNAYQKLPPLKDKYRFALAAEESWSIYLLAEILPKIEAGETYTFRLQKRNSIKISNELLELEINKKVQRLNCAQISEIKVANDKIAIKEEGAREGWIFSEGVHTVAFNDLGNARMFLLLIQEVFSIPVVMDNPA